MAQTKNRSPKKTAADASIAVDDFMVTLEHPQQAAVAALRDIIRAADPSIAEGVKWNRAKLRGDAEVRIEDPEGLLAWLGPDRAVVHFADVDEVQARGHALQRLVRQWIAFV